MVQKLVSQKRNLLTINTTNTLLIYYLTAEIFAARLTQANLITKTDFDEKLSSFNKKITSEQLKNI